MARHGRIAEEVFLGVRASRDSGMTYKQIASAFGICTATVGNICRAESYERYKSPKNEFGIGLELQESDAPRFKEVYLIEVKATQSELRKIVQFALSTMTEDENAYLRTYGTLDKEYVL